MGNRSHTVSDADWHVHIQHRGEDYLLDGAQAAVLEDLGRAVVMASEHCDLSPMLRLPELNDVE